MVVFVDLDGDDDELQTLHNEGRLLGTAQLQELRLDGRPSRPDASTTTSPADERSPDVNKNGFSAALSCYPIAVSLSSHLDLNDLHSLSRTCRQFRVNLLQFHHQLIQTSLRCTFDEQPLLADILAAHKTISYAGEDLDPTNIPSNVLAAISAAQRSPLTDHLLGSHSKLLRSSKIGKCARDLVAECRKCSKVVCRNCAAKPPSDRCLQDRHRRLCRSCLEAPLQAHTTLDPQPAVEPDLLLTPSSSASSTRSARSESSSSSTDNSVSPLSIKEDIRSTSPAAFTSSAFQRSPCSCATRGVFLCQTCGQNLRAADTTYKRVWTWRSRYSTHIGGLGTGMGEGDQGQKCGRGERCLARTGGGLCWVEIDCSDQSRPRTSSSQGLPSSADSTEGVAASDADSEFEVSSDTKPGYLRQEIEGIGGVVKKKVKKKIRVGATVWEFDDERESGKYLVREASGSQRSWCGWCSRVVLGERDRQEWNGQV